MYGVDKQIGEAIRESGVPRGEIFVTSKAWPHFLAPENVELCLDKVLKETGLEYVDLFLAHWPVAWKPASREALEKATAGPQSTNEDKGTLYEGEKPVVDWQHSSGPIAKKKGQEGSFVQTWARMQQLVVKGKARAVGVSNFGKGRRHPMSETPANLHAFAFCSNRGHGRAAPLLTRSTDFLQPDRSAPMAATDGADRLGQQARHLDDVLFSFRRPESRWKDAAEPSSSHATRGKE